MLKSFRKIKFKTESKVSLLCGYDLLRQFSNKLGARVERNATSFVRLRTASTVFMHVRQISVNNKGGTMERLVIRCNTYIRSMSFIPP